MMLNTRARRARSLSVILLGTIVVAGCTAQSDTAGEPEEVAPAAEAVDPAASDGATGDIVLCGGKDTGVQSTLIDSFNAAQSDVTAEYVELGPNTDEARTQAIQRLEGGSTDCDVYMTDVTWTPEWASQGWILDQTELVDELSGGMMPSVVSTTEYDGRNWATPFYTNAGLILYRSDRVEAPATWQDLYAQASESGDNALLTQLKPYEGLTVNFLELLYSAGGAVLDENGEVVVDSDQTRAVLKAMTDALASGAIDGASLTYDETGVRRAFESGAGGFQRNWPNSYASALATDVGEVTAVAPLPAFDENSEPSGVLGGWNLAVAKTSENVGGAVALIRYTAGEEFQKKMFLENAQAPVIDAIYEDADVVEAIPFADSLHSAVQNARPRPKSPVYAQISGAIYENVYAAISGEATADEAIAKMVSEIEAAQETF